MFHNYIVELLLLLHIWNHQRHSSLQHSPFTQLIANHDVKKGNFPPIQTRLRVVFFPFESAEKLDEAKLTEKFSTFQFLFLLVILLSTFALREQFLLSILTEWTVGSYPEQWLRANRNWYFCWWEIERESIKAAANESHPGRTWETLLTTSWQRQDW